MNIVSIIVVEGKGNGPDHVVIKTDMPCPYQVDCNLTLHFNASLGTGIEYVRKHFKVEPKVI